jgi:class 3 adenylate cyclase/YHS domain-containing protein
VSLGREIDAVFLIADLVGYTALTEAMGGGEAVKVIDRYVKLAETALARDVRIVERVGDELLVVAAEPVPVIETAIQILAAVEAEPMFPEVRAGIHGGPVIERAGKYFGAALNLTARLAVYAQPGQVLCTEHIAAACPGTRAFECQAIGPVRFKNVVGPVDVFEIVTKQRPSEPMVLDPVCRMQIRPGTASARQLYAGTTYYFCSLDCARAFAESPQAYIEG